MIPTSLVVCWEQGTDGGRTAELQGEWGGSTGGGCSHCEGRGLVPKLFSRKEESISFHFALPSFDGLIDWFVRAWQQTSSLLIARLQLPWLGAIRCPQLLPLPTKGRMLLTGFAQKPQMHHAHTGSRSAPYGCWSHHASAM